MQAVWPTAAVVSPSAGFLYVATWTPPDQQRRSVKYLSVMTREFAFQSVQHDESPHNTVYRRFSSQDEAQELH